MMGRWLSTGSPNKCLSLFLAGGAFLPWDRNEGGCARHRAPAGIAGPETRPGAPHSSPGEPTAPLPLEMLPPATEQGCTH